MLIDNDELVRFGQLFRKKCRRRYIREHDAIQNNIGAELRKGGFRIGYEIKDERGSSRYRYDLVAATDTDLWVIEVKSEINIRDFGQIEAYARKLKGEFDHAKVWLGTDCLNYWTLMEGEIGEMTRCLMKDLNVGIILINPKGIWTPRNYSDLLAIEEKGHLCENCHYCDGFEMNGVAQEILLAIEQRRAVPDHVNPEFQLYKGSLEVYKEVKKTVLDTKRFFGEKEFERRYGLKISD